jgi:hypothetical protein
VCCAADGQRTAQLLGKRLLEMLLDAVHFHRRQESAVGQLCEALGLAAHADEAFHVLVPGFDILVANRPIDGRAVLRVRLEIHRTQSIRLPSPHERTSAHVIAADPVEAFGLAVRMFAVVHEPMLGGLRHDVTGSCRCLVTLEILLSGTATVRQFPQIFGRSWIVAVTDHASAIEHQGFQAFFREFLGGPAAADARADDDGIVNVVLVWRHCRIHPPRDTADCTAKGFAY